MNYYISSPDSSTAGSFYEPSLSFGSRPSSTDPSLNRSFSAGAKLRQDACRGFDIEDDNEFCPALAQYPIATPVAAPQVPAPYSHNAHPYAIPHERETTAKVALRARKALEIIDPATGMPVGRR